MSCVWQLQNKRKYDDDDDDDDDVAQSRHRGVKAAIKHKVQRSELEQARMSSKCSARWPHTQSNAVYKLLEMSKRRQHRPAVNLRCGIRGLDDARVSELSAAVVPPDKRPHILPAHLAMPLICSRSFQSSCHPSHEHDTQTWHSKALCHICSALSNVGKFWAYL